MVAFRDFLEPGARNDRIIQMALRDIDAEVLISALLGMDEEIRGMVYRNMSKRALGFLSADLELRKGTSRETIQAAGEFFRGLLEKHAAAFVEEPTGPSDRKPPSLDFATSQATIASLLSLSEFVRDKGFLSLEELADKVPEPLLRKGLLMLIEGWDPLLIRSILETYKASYLRSQENRFDLVISAVESMAAKESYIVTELKLRALVAEL